MRIKEILENNGYETQNISDKILAFETGNCKNIRDIPVSMAKMFDGVEIFDKDDESKLIILNFEYNEDDEFLPLYVYYYGVDGYPSVELQYNENAEVEYVNDLR